jgi:sulfite oxidase
MLAAGAAADPFWVIYNAHNTPHTRELLERYRIGNLAAADVAAGAAAIASAADPYASDPPRSPLLAMRSEKPCNAEPPAALLADSYITREEVMFVRNHLPVPIVAEAEYALKVAGEGLGGRTLRLSLADLKDAARFPPVTVTVALECAGNRRAAMNAGYDGAKPTRGLTWGPGAIANVEFKGARLLDVLEAAGKAAAELVRFFKWICTGACCVQGWTFRNGRLQQHE